MPLVLTEVPARAVPPAPGRKLWTRAECAALEAAGLLDYSRHELVEGALIDRMGMNRPHGCGVQCLYAWLIGIFGWDFVNSEMPIGGAAADSAMSEPVPDVMVLKRSTWEFPSNPQPADLHLVVEVSDSTLTFDRTTKAALYARAGILEYWVLDINGRCLIVHRELSAGGYRSVISYAEGESISPLAAPHASFGVSELFAKLDRLGI